MPVDDREKENVWHDIMPVLLHDAGRRRTATWRRGRRQEKEKYHPTRYVRTVDGI